MHIPKSSLKDCMSLLDDHNLSIVLNSVDWDKISSRSTLNWNIISSCKDFLNLDIVIRNNTLPEEFIQENYHRFNRAYLYIYQKFSAKFLEDHKNTIVWDSALIHQEIPENLS